MKKLLAIFALCFAFFAAKAQFFLLQESFDDGTIPADWVAIDADGDGYNWGAEADADYEDEGYSHTGMGMAYSASYVNYVGAINTDHWLITNAITIPSTATAPTLTWWTKSAYADEYEVYVSTTGNSVSDFGTTPLVPSTAASTSYTQGTQSLNAYIGQTIYIAFRHHFTDGFFLFLDDVEVFYTPTIPTLSSLPNAMNFGTVIAGDSAVRPATVSAYNLTAGITATTTAPFAVSLNNSAYATSVTLPATGGTLYVKYAPTAAGTDNAIVALASGDVTDTIVLAGVSVECNTITDYPYSTDFSDEVKNLCWTIEDANNDGSTFTLNDEYGAYYTYNEDNDANDWLISPEFTLTGHEYVAFDYSGHYGPENFEVYLIQGENRTLIVDEIATTSEYYYGDAFETLVVDLRDTTAGTYQIGIRCTSEADGYYFFVTNFMISDEAVIAADEDSIGMGAVAINTDTLFDYVNVTTIAVSGPVTVTTAAPFLVSLDDSLYTTSVTIPADTRMMRDTVVYLGFAPTAEGAFNGTVIFTNGTVADTMMITGTGVDCRTITEFPYETDFSDEVKNVCWTIEDANNDGKTFRMSTSDKAAIYVYNLNSNADDWLISPEFTLTGNEYFSFDYKVYSSSNPEKFEVYLIQDTVYTRLIDTVTATNTDYLTMIQDLRADTGNYQIGFHCISDTNKWRLYFTNFVVATASQSIAVEPASINYGIVIVDEYAQETVTLSTLNVMDSIVVTTAAPFSISLNDTTFTTTLTIPAREDFAANIPVYVRYTPDTIGLDSGMVTFYALTESALGEELVLTDTVLLAGEGFECNTIAEFPYFTDFSDTYKNLCWRINDANNDGSTFEFDDEDGAYYGWDHDNAADDWLISPEFNLTGAEYVGFDYFVGWASYPEKFSVHLLRDTVDIVLMPTATYTNEDPETMLLALDAYTGPCRIAIHAESNANMYELYITNFTVDSLANLDEELTVNPTSIDFGSVIYSQGVTATEMAMVTAIVVPDSLTVTTAAPFAVSLDGTNYVDSLIIPAAAISHTNLYVQYAPDTFGTHTGIVTISGDTLTATIALTGKAIDCNSAATLPFVEDFEDEISACWSNIDNDGDGNYWTQLVGEDYADYAHGGSGFFTSASYTSGGALTPDNWLITPKIAIPAEGACLEFWVGPQDPDWPGEHYQVMVSTTGNNVSDFSTVLVEETLSQSVWVRRTVNLEYPSQNVYVAFVHNESSDVFRINLDDINITAGLSGVEESEISAVSIYPNPASTVLNVHAENYRTVQIVNFLGQVVYSANVTENDFQINVSNLSNGVYFIRLNGETSTTQKFIKR